jgi:hypothetical protein
MIKTLEYRIIMGAFILVAFFFAGRTFAAGESPGEMLNAVLPAEYIAIGRTFAGLSSGAGSCWANPAGIAHANSVQAVVNGMMGIAEVKGLNGSVLVPFKNFGNMEFGAGTLGAGDEDYESGTGIYDPARKLRYSNLLFSLGYGRHVTGHFSAGAGLKFIGAETGFDKQNRVFVDLGVLLDFPFLNFTGSVNDNFAMGFMLRNLQITGTGSEGFGELRVGIKYGIITHSPIDFTLAVDAWSFSGLTLGYSCGGRILFYKLFALSAGFNPSYEDKLVFGAGFSLKIGLWRWELNYALHPGLASGLNVLQGLQLTLITH